MLKEANDKQSVELTLVKEKLALRDVDMEDLRKKLAGAEKRGRERSREASARRRECEELKRQLE